MLWKQTPRPIRMLEFVRMLKCETWREIQSLWEGGDDGGLGGGGGGGLLLHHEVLIHHKVLLRIQALVPGACGSIIKGLWTKIKLCWIKSVFGPSTDTCWYICIVFYAKIQQGWVELIMQMPIIRYFSSRVKSLESYLSQCRGNPAGSGPHYLLVTDPVSWEKITKDEVSGGSLALWLSLNPLMSFCPQRLFGPEWCRYIGWRNLICILNLWVSLRILHHRLLFRQNSLWQCQSFLTFHGKQEKRFRIHFLVRINLYL